jgi:hypothetical protein
MKTFGYVILDSSVGIRTGWIARVRFPKSQDFSLLHSVQTDLEVDSASYPMDTGGSLADG